MKNITSYYHSNWNEKGTLKSDHYNGLITLLMLGVVADPVALAKYRLWSIDRNDKSRC